MNLALRISLLEYAHKNYYSRDLGSLGEEAQIMKLFQDIFNCHRFFFVCGKLLIYSSLIITVHQILEITKKMSFRSIDYLVMTKSTDVSR